MFLSTAHVYTGIDVIQQRESGGCRSALATKEGHRSSNGERLAAIQIYENNVDTSRIAEILSVRRASVYDWNRRLPGERSGGDLEQEMIRLYPMINGKDPRCHNFGMALRTWALIRDLIKRAFGKTMSMVTRGPRPGQGRHVSAAAAARAWKQDPAWVDRWKREEYPAIRARTRGSGRDDPVR